MQYNFKDKLERRHFYKSNAWRGVNGVRNQAVKRDKECVWCRDKGLVTIDNLEVDHIIPVEECTYAQAIDLNNVRVLCRSCHNLRHNRFDGKEDIIKRFISDEKW